MNLKDILDEIGADIIKDITKCKIKRKKTLVGNVSEEIQREYRAYKGEKETLEEEMELRMQQLKIEVEQKMHKEFNQRMKMIGEKHHFIWSKITRELDLDKKENFNINPDDGSVYKIEKIKIEKDNTGTNKH